MITPLDVALTQLDVFESTGHNDGVPADRYMRGDKLAWCAGFSIWCYDMADTDSMYETAREYYSLRNVQKMENEMKARGKWFGHALHRNIMPSDLVFFGDRGRSDKGKGRHVGLVESADMFEVHTVEGNTSNAVKLRSYSLQDKRITGYARP